MKPKNDLNNVQRKMLDDIYSEEFYRKEREILAIRSEESQKMREQMKVSALKQYGGHPEIKKLLKCGAEFVRILDGVKQYLAENNIDLTNQFSVKPEVSLSYRYSYENHPEFQKLKKYDQDTDSIRGRLAQKKNEMRARIYGSGVSYDEAEKEIAAILKGIA